MSIEAGDRVCAEYDMNQTGIVQAIDADGVATVKWDSGKVEEVATTNLMSAWDGDLNDNDDFIPKVW